MEAERTTETHAERNARRRDAYRRKKSGSGNGHNRNTTTDSESRNQEAFVSNDKDNELPINVIQMLPKPTTAPTKKEIKMVEPVKMVLMTGSAILASRLGELWNMSPSEATAISEPLARILERLGWLETTSKYADYAMLATALGVYVTPRIIAMQMEVPKKEVKNVNQTTNNSTTDYRASDPKSTPDGTSYVKAAFAGIY